MTTVMTLMNPRLNLTKLKVGLSLVVYRVKKKKTNKSYDQEFRSEWLANPKMKCWLTRYKKGQYDFGKFCNLAITPKLSVLQTHMTLKKHRTLTDSTQGNNMVGLGGKFSFIPANFLT